ncbi:MAG: hypothetical protein AAF799_27225 [Myxococcota bacterium]
MMRPFTARCLGCLALLALANCGTTDRDDNPFDSSALETATTNGASEDSTMGGSGEGQADGSGSNSADGTDDGDDDDDGTPKLDIMGGADDGIGEQEGCRGIDFLFVIDNSGSMEDEQANLLASFPGFVQAMQGALAESAQSFRVMVVDTDGIGTGCAPICDMFGPMGYCSGISCAGEQCDVNVGGGNTVNRSNGSDCGLPGGRRYADTADTDITSAFNCMARVGTTGSGVELVADSLQTALSPDYLGAGGCNAEFIRDDAVLVVTIITDEDDAGNDPYMTSPGEPAGWYNDLAAVKNYDPDAVVVLGLLGDTNEPGGICTPYEDGTGDGAENATRLREFVQLFGDKGLLGSVCAPNYTSFFDEAVGLIDTTCQDFEPEG